MFLFYVVGLVAASWHFAYGIWLFSAKWGIVSGDKAQKRLLRACLALFLVLCAAGFASLYSFRTHPVAEGGENSAMVDVRHVKPGAERKSKITTEDTGDTEENTSAGSPSHGKPVQ